jgi:uncharacterized protein (DUF1684 family)
MEDAFGFLELLDWRRRIHDLYGEVRSAADPRAAWKGWRAVRDELFRTHACSPLPRGERRAFRGLAYFEHDPSARVLGSFEPAPPERLEIEASAVGPFAIDRVGRVSFDLAGDRGSLDVYWMQGYAGGLFLPFADATSGAETYGAGRYLLDTVKGADLGSEHGALVLDFNFAYAPSCAYDPRWACPLAPPGNRLPFAVRAGERFAVTGDGA